MDIDIWVIVTLNNLFIRDSYTQFRFQKYIFSGKTPFFVIDPFRIPDFICLNIDGPVLYENVALSIIVLLSVKPCSSFLKRFLFIGKLISTSKH